MASQEEDNKLECLSNVNKEQERYDLNVYKKYDSILNDKAEKFENKVQSLIEVWKSISELNFSQFDIKYIIQIIDWAKLHALNIVLTGEWRSTKENFRDSLLQCIEKAQASLANVNNAFSTRCQKLADVVKKPWEDPVLYNLIQERDAEIGSKEIEFFCVETAYLVSVRLKKLCENHCEDLALNLVTNFLKYKNLASVQNLNLNATETQLWFIFDIYVALLYKFQDKEKILQQFEDLKLEEGVQLIKRFAKKRVKISKIWRNCHKIAIFGCRFYLPKALMKYSEQIKEFLTDLLKTYLALSNTDALLQEFVVSVRNLTNFADAAGLCSMCEVIHREGAERLRHFAIEMYIRALTTDMNELERLKHLSEDEKMKTTTSRLAHTFSNLADLLDDHVKVARECVLTAFSLEPTQERLKKIEELARRSGFPVLDTGQEWKCRLHPPILPTDDLAWVCPECGEWMCKPELNTPLQMNIPLQEALQESVLGISEALCDDLVVCLSNPRYQILSWLLSWGDLYRLCILYLNDPEKTKNFVTELKFVDVDYSLFDHIKREPVDEYTGIEKGYEQYLDLNFVSDEETSSVSEDSMSHDRYVGLGSDGTGDTYLSLPQPKSDPNTLKSLRMFRPNLKRKRDDSDRIAKKVALSVQNNSASIPGNFMKHKENNSNILFAESISFNPSFQRNVYLPQAAGVARNNHMINSNPVQGNSSIYNRESGKSEMAPSTKSYEVPKSHSLLASTVSQPVNSVFSTTDLGRVTSTNYVSDIIKSNLSFGVPKVALMLDSTASSQVSNLQNNSLHNSNTQSTLLEEGSFVTPSPISKKNAVSYSKQDDTFVTPSSTIQKTVKSNHKTSPASSQFKSRTSYSSTMKPNHSVNALDAILKKVVKDFDNDSHNTTCSESKNGVAATLPQLGGQVANNHIQTIQVSQPQIHNLSPTQMKSQPETCSLSGTTGACKTKPASRFKQDDPILSGSPSKLLEKRNQSEKSSQTSTPGKDVFKIMDLEVKIPRMNLEKYLKDQNKSKPDSKMPKTISSNLPKRMSCGQQPVQLKELMVRITKLNESCVQARTKTPWSLKNLKHQSNLQQNCQNILLPQQRELSVQLRSNSIIENLTVSPDLSKSVFRPESLTLTYQKEQCSTHKKVSKISPSREPRHPTVEITSSSLPILPDKTIVIPLIKSKEIFPQSTALTERSFKTTNSLESQETSSPQGNKEEKKTHSGISKIVQKTSPTPNLMSTCTNSSQIPALGAVNCDKDKIQKKTELDLRVIVHDVLKEQKYMKLKNDLEKEVENDFRLRIEEELPNDSKQSSSDSIMGNNEITSDNKVVDETINSDSINDIDNCSTINKTIVNVNKTLDCDNQNETDLHIEKGPLGPANCDKTETLMDLTKLSEDTVNSQTKDAMMIDDEIRREKTCVEVIVDTNSINTNTTHIASAHESFDDPISAINTNSDSDNHKNNSIIDLDPSLCNDSNHIDSIQYRTVTEFGHLKIYDSTQDVMSWKSMSAIIIQSSNFEKEIQDTVCDRIINNEEGDTIIDNYDLTTEIFGKIVSRDIVTDFQHEKSKIPATSKFSENKNLEIQGIYSSDDKLMDIDNVESIEGTMDNSKSQLAMCSLPTAFHEQQPFRSKQVNEQLEQVQDDLGTEIGEQSLIQYIHNYCDPFDQSEVPPIEPSISESDSSLQVNSLDTNVAGEYDIVEILLRPNAKIGETLFEKKVINHSKGLVRSDKPNKIIFRIMGEAQEYNKLRDIPIHLRQFAWLASRLGDMEIVVNDEVSKSEINKENAVVCSRQNLAQALEKAVKMFYNMQNYSLLRMFNTSFGFHSNVDCLKRTPEQDTIVPFFRPADIKIYSNSRKRKHDNVPCFKLDQEKKRKKRSKTKRLTVVLNRLPEVINWPNVTVVIQDPSEVNDDRMDADAFDLYKRVTPLLDNNVKNEINKKLAIYSDNKAEFVKKSSGVHINIYEDKFYSMTAKINRVGRGIRGHVRFKVPGLNDYSLFLPRNVNHTVNVVQHSNPRTSSVTNQNTQTSTQVTPHIQRIGQPKLSDIKPERYDDDSQQPSSSTGSVRPSCPSQSALINILSSTKPGPKSLSPRQAPYVNISQQVLRPVETPNTTVIKLESEDNADQHATKTVNTNLRIVTTTTQAGAAPTISTPSQGGTILQLICKSSSLPKFQQAFGKTVYQGGSASDTSAETTTPANENSTTSQTAAIVEAKKIAAKALPVNVQPITGNVIFRGQVPVGQTVSLIPPGSNTRQLFRITGSSHEQISLVKETVIQNKMSALLAAALQGKPKISEQNGELVEEYSATRITLCRPGTVPPNATRIVKPVQLQIPANVIRAPQPNVSSTTLEQLREFDMVYKQVKERSSNPAQPETSPQPSQESPQQQRISFTYVNQVQKYTQLAPVVVVSSYSPIQQNVTPASTVTSQGGSGTCLTQVSTVAVPKVAVKSSKGKSIKSSVAKTSPTTVPSIPKPQQKPQEDEHTTQRIFDILAEYAEQLRNSPDLNNKPAPRRRSNPPTNPSSNTSSSSSSKKKKKKCSSSTSNLVETDNEDLTMGSEDSSGGNVVQLSMTDEEQSQSASITPPESNLEPATTNTPTPRPLIVTDGSNQPRNVIIAADSSVGEALKIPNTALLMPGNYIMPVSVVKGGQQIAVVSGRSKILTTVPARSGQNMLLFQSFVNQNKKGGISAVKYSTLQPFSTISSQNVGGVGAQTPVVLPSSPVATVALGQPITLKKIDDNDRVGNTELLLTISQPRETVKIEKARDIPQPDSSTNLSCDSMDSKAEDNPTGSSRDIFNNIQKTNSVATSVIASVTKKDEDGRRDLNSDPSSIVKVDEAKQNERIGSVLVNASTSNGPMLSHTNPRYRKPVNDGVESSTSAVKGFTHNAGKVSQSGTKIFKNNAVYYAIRTKKPINKKLDSEAQKQAAIERELRLQKTLSEECEDLGVDEPSTSDLFPEADLLFDSTHSPSYEHSGQKIQGSDDKTKNSMHLFIDDENSGPLRNDLFDYVEYHPPEPGIDQMNGNNMSNESRSCDDSTLLTNCGNMSEVTLNSPISPDYNESSHIINKYKYKYTNRKKGEKIKIQPESWQEVTEVSSSDDTMELVKEDETPIPIQEETVIDEAVTEIESIVMEHSKSPEDDVTPRCPIHGPAENRGFRKSKKTCTCFNGSRSPNVLNAKKRVNSPKSQGPTPSKKMLIHRKR